MSATGRKPGVPNWTAAEIDVMMNAVGSIKPITTSQWDQAWSVFCASFPSTPRTAASMQEKFRLLSKAGDPRAVQAYAPPPLPPPAAAADEPEPKRARLLEEIGALRAEQREMKAMVLAILDTTRIISFQLTHMNGTQT